MFWTAPGHHLSGRCVLGAIVAQARGSQDYEDVVGRAASWPLLLHIQLILLAESHSEFGAAGPDSCRYLFHMPPSFCQALATTPDPTCRAQVPEKGGSPVVVCPWSDTAATLLSYAQVPTFAVLGHA